MILDQSLLTHTKQTVIDLLIFLRSTFIDFLIVIYLLKCYTLLLIAVKDVLIWINIWSCIFSVEKRVKSDLIRNL